MPKKKTWSVDELLVLGVRNTTLTKISHREKVETTCVSCRKRHGLVVFGNLITRLKKFGAGWHCEECQLAVMSAKARERLAAHNHWTGKRHSEESKEKIRKTRADATAKAVETNYKKYGVSHPCQTVALKEQIQNTNREKYGAGSFLASEEWKGKKDEFFLKKYGVKNPRQSEEIIEKSKQTNLERYGSDSYSKTDKFRDSIRGLNHPKRRKEYADALWKTTSGELLVDLCKSHDRNLSNGIRIFKRYGEESFLSWLKTDYSGNSLEILGSRLFNLPFLNKKISPLNYRPDFQITPNVFMNLDGLYYHSEYLRHKRYHFDMREQYEAVGRRILQFREDEVVYAPQIVKSIVSGILGEHVKVHARKCAIQRLTSQEMQDFFNKNHLMGNYGAAKGWGLFFAGQLVCAISVRNLQGGIEISRFGSCLNTRVVGGFSRLLSHVEKIYNSQKVVSFCDLRYGTGEVYSKNGFTLEGVTLGWNWTDGRAVFNRKCCRANMDARNLSEAEYAQELGWFKIYDAGQARFVKYLGPDKREL